MRTTIGAFLCAVFLSCNGIAFGQADTLSTRGFLIKFSPQHLVLNGVHLELEKSVGFNNRHSVLVSPRFYKGDVSYTNSLYNRESVLDEQTEVSGYGGAILHRIYMNGQQTNRQVGFYLSYGVDYHHFNLAFVRRGYVREVDEEGLEYYKFRERPFSEKIDRYGAVAMVGHQESFLHERIIVDFSFGFGYRESLSKTNYSEILFSEGAYDYGHTGTYLLLNFKIGVAL